MRVWNRVFAIGLVSAMGCGAWLSASNAADIFEDIVATSAPVLDIDPSLRSVGMGGASTAVFWGNNPNHWANPALLGSVTGVRFEASDVSLLPEALPGFKFRTRRATLGYGCLGVALVGEPFDGLGEQSLGGGALPADPNVLAQTLLLPHETARSWGAGVSAARGLESLAHGRGHDAPAITRRNDVEFGINRKTVTDNTNEPTNPQHLTAYDYGVLARTSVPLRRTLRGVPGHVHALRRRALARQGCARLGFERHV